MTAKSMIGRCLLLKKSKKEGVLKNSSQLSVTIIPHIYRKDKRKNATNGSTYLKFNYKYLHSSNPHQNGGRMIEIYEAYELFCWLLP